MVKTAWLGLGVMGFPMAGHLVARGGCDMTVYNRSVEKAARWTATHKGKSAATPREAVADADFVFACVGNDDDLRQVTIIGVVALGLFTLMNASSLLRIVERQPFGWQRTVEVALVKPIDSLSHLLFLDRPRLTADDALGHEFGDSEAFDELTTAAPPAADRKSVV